MEATTVDDMRPSARLKGMGMAVLFLGLFGGLWMIAALNTESLVWVLICALLPASLLALRGLGLLHTSRRVAATEPELTAEEREQRHVMGRYFALTFIAEFGAIAIAANVLESTNQSAWILAAIGFIVGVHFIPLARIFKYPLYYWTGGVEIALCALIAWIMRGRLLLADPLFGLAMGLTLWLTVLVVLVQARWLAVRALAAEQAASEPA
ncbi:MAG: hypothetical protein ACRD1M_14800 [Terriglobales bacterium]